jgi:predicted transcriptional regulator
MTKRTDLEIMVEMLCFCRTPQSKTKVTHHSSVPWKAFQKHLSMLVSKGFLQIHHSRIKYVTTQKGICAYRKVESANRSSTNVEARERALSDEEKVACVYRACNQNPEYVTS